MPYKVSVHAIQAGARHSIVFHHGGDAIGPIMSSMEQVFLPAYVKCLDQLTTVRKVKVTNINGSRDFYTKKFNLNGTQDSNELSFADVSKTAAYFKLYTAAGRSRDLCLRGLTDAAVKRTNTGRFERSAKFKTQSDRLMAAIKEAGLCMQLQKPVTETGFDWKPVASFAPVANSGNRLTTVAVIGDHGLSDGFTVHIAAPPSSLLLLPFRGKWKVTQATSATFVIPAVFQAAATINAPADTRLRRIDYTHPAIDTAVFDKFSSRDTADIEGGRGAARPRTFRQAVS